MCTGYSICKNQTMEQKLQHVFTGRKIAAYPWNVARTPHLRREGISTLCSFYNQFPSNFIKVSMVCFHTTLSQWSRVRLKSIKAGVPRSTSIFIHIVKFVMLFFSGIALYKCFQLKVFRAVKSGNLHFFFLMCTL